MEGNKRLAVLVGCNYAGTEHVLHGCINDVRDMHDTLVTRFGFQEEDISVLTDEPGMDPLPTAATIKRVLFQMIVKAQPGDVLLFHFSGHGTVSEDGLDEMIVGSDFNFVTDYDLRQLVNRLPAGASFTIISDSCHSGGLIDKEKEQIGPSTSHHFPLHLHHHHRSRVLSSRCISPEALLQHLTSLSALDSANLGDHVIYLFGPEASPKFLHKDIAAQKLQLHPDNGILLSGCQKNETSEDLSPEEADGEPCGAFSHALQKILKEHKGALSNRELVTRARKLLHKDKDTREQHPCLYCSDANADASFLMEKQE